MNGREVLNLLYSPSLTARAEVVNYGRGVVPRHLTSAIASITIITDVSSSATPDPITAVEVKRAVEEREVANISESWVLAFSRQMEGMRNLSENWDGYGTIPPNATALRIAQDALDILYDIDLCPSNLSPSVEEGVTVSFHSDERYAVLECYNDGEICSAIYQGNVEPEVRDVGSSVIEIKEVLGLINTFINAG